MATLSTKCDRSYTLVHPELVEATLVPCDDATGDGCTAQLQEISPASAKLLVQGPPELSTECSIRLSSTKLANPLEIAAQLDWARPNPAGDWLVECEFQPRLTTKIFSRLLVSGLLERRSSVRIQTRIPVQVQCGSERMPAVVRDLSEGGLCLCLVTRQAPPKTRQVTVIAETARGAASLEVKVRWTLQVGAEYLIGCQFARSEDFDVLHKAQPAAEAQYFEHSRARKPGGADR